MTARLLVVEDEPVINQAVTDRLRASGYAVRQAFTGPEAVAAVDAEEPDAVILDIMLPGFDGIEVCRQIQSRRPVPVLMLTARDDESDILVGLGVGADDYLTKPFRMRELLARVHALLRRVERAEVLARKASGSMIDFDRSTALCPSDSPKASRSVASETNPRATSSLPTGWLDFICSSRAMRNWSSLITPCVIRIWPIGRRGLGEFILA